MKVYFSVWHNFRFFHNIEAHNDLKRYISAMICACAQSV